MNKPRIATESSEPAVHRFCVLLLAEPGAPCAAVGGALARLRPEWAVRECAPEAPALLQAIDASAPRLLVLVGRADAGADALALLKILPYPIPCIVVAETGDAAAQAYDLGALDYLTLPLGLARLERALLRLSELVPAAAPLALGPRPRTEWLVAKRNDEIVILPVQEIIYLQTQLKYTRVVWTGGEALIRSGLGAVEAQLDARSFCRIHRSAIVNIGHVVSLSRDELGRLCLSMRGRGEQLLVGRAFEGRFHAPVDLVAEG